jgi:hypothetical protein
MREKVGFGVAGVVGIAGLVGLVAALSACDSGGDCGKVQPCGGSVVGTWKAAHACVSQAAAQSETSATLSGCTSAQTSVSATVSGTATYNADGTYSRDQTIGGTAQVLFPPSCLSASGLTVSCDQLNQLFALEQATQNITGIQSFDCKTAGMSCSCTIVLSPQTINETGTYSTAGTQIQLSSGTNVESDSYCVQGSELHVITLQASANMGAMGTMTIASDLVFDKQ